MKRPSLNNHSHERLHNLIETRQKTPMIGLLIRMTTYTFQDVKFQQTLLSYPIILEPKNYVNDFRIVTSEK